MPALPACSVCAAGITWSLFPPAALWAGIGVLWFLALSWRARSDAPTSWIARPVASVVWLLLFTASAVILFGHAVYLLLLPFCAASTVVEICSRRAAGAPKERRRLVLLSLVVAASLGVTGGVAYWRVSRMTPAERVARVQNTPGAEIEVARVASSRPDPRGDYRAILAATGSPLVARAIARHIDCPNLDRDCALLLADLLVRLEPFDGADPRVESELRSASGLDLPPGTPAETWHAALAEAPSPE